MVWRQVAFQVYDKEFARWDAIAILTFVACAQLLTWLGLRLKLQTQKRPKRKQRPWILRGQIAQW